MALALSSGRPARYPLTGSACTAMRSQAQSSGTISKAYQSGTGRDYTGLAGIPAYPAAAARPSTNSSTAACAALMAASLGCRSGMMIGVPLFGCQISTSHPVPDLDGMCTASS